jgi:hypothetical protein
MMMFMSDVVAIRDSSWTVLSSTLPAPFLTIAAGCLVGEDFDEGVDNIAGQLDAGVVGGGGEDGEGPGPSGVSTRPAAVTAATRGLSKDFADY